MTTEYDKAVEVAIRDMTSIIAQAVIQCVKNDYDQVDDVNAQTCLMVALNNAHASALTTSVKIGCLNDSVIDIAAEMLRRTARDTNDTCQDLMPTKQ